MCNNRETVIIPQTIIIPTKSIFVASLVHDASYVRFGETKEKYFNRSLSHGTEMRHQNVHSDSVLVHTGYMVPEPYWYRVSVPNPTPTLNLPLKQALCIRNTVWHQITTTI